MLIYGSTPRRRKAAFVIALGTAAILGTAYASPKHKQVDQDALAQAVAFQSALTSIAESVSPSVVSIQVEMTRPQQGPMPFFGAPGGGGIVRGGGSGVILRSDGFILTNNHVIRGASRIDVTLQNDKTYPAELVGADSASDLAVLKIDATGLRAAEFASSEDARVGQFVVAIGSPFGLDYTVTTGVLSAKGRGGIGANEIEDYLQTDASINPGNSGGPLVDLNGDVLGINTMIIGRGSGIGFAIPSEIARRVARQLIAGGAVKRAWLGVAFQEITPELAAHFGGGFEGGALVSSVVEGGPADQAGLQAGDVIIAVGDSRIQEGHDLLRTVLRHEVGERMSLAVRRGPKTMKITLVTGERPGEEGALSTTKGATADEMLGLSVRPITPSLRQQSGYQGDGQMFVSQVAPGSEADRAGLQPGDVVLQADQARVGSAQDIVAALEDGTALLYIERDSRKFFRSLSRSK